MAESTDRSGFMCQFAKASAEVKKMKAETPYLFPEFQALQLAKHELALAQARLERAQKAWDER